jgi:hypothetical protein
VPVVYDSAIFKLRVNEFTTPSDPEPSIVQSGYLKIRIRVRKIKDGRAYVE